jgi:hypothetical protein
MGDMRNAYKILVEDLKERDHSQDVVIDGRITLNWILGNRVVGCGLNSSSLG